MRPSARRILLGLVAAAFALAYAALVPTATDPAAWAPPPAPPMAGVLAPNDALSRVERLDVGGTGPEDLDFGPEGRLYAGLGDGRIMRLVPGGRPETFASTGGRPLGLRFAPDGRLIVADAHRGLLAVDAAGRVSVLATAEGGRRFALTDDLDVARDGTVYFTDATDEHPVEDSERAVIEHRPRGRLLAFGPDGRTHLVRDGIAFANGVALAADESYVLVSELASYRILRCWLAGERGGACDVFAENLPGFPDGLSRGEDGVFWVALLAPRVPLLDRAHPHPAFKRVLLRLPSWMKPAAKAYGWVLGLDETGQVVRNLQDPTGRGFAFITNVVEHEGWLYFGSLRLPAVGRIRRP